MTVALNAACILPTRAQNEGGNDEFVVRPTVYRRLLDAQKALSKEEYAEAEEKTKKAMAELEMNRHERALSLQTLAMSTVARRGTSSARRPFR